MCFSFSLVFEFTMNYFRLNMSLWSFQSMLILMAINIIVFIMFHYPFALKLCLFYLSYLTVSLPFYLSILISLYFSSSLNSLLPFPPLGSFSLSHYLFSFPHLWNTEQRQLDYDRYYIQSIILEFA